MVQKSESQQEKHAPNCIYKNVWFNNLIHPSNHQDAKKFPYKIDGKQHWQWAT